MHTGPSLLAVFLLLAGLYDLAYAQDLGGREGLIRGKRLGTLRILR
jgi:hypothetical protein